MPLAAITYDVKPGFDDEIAEIFSPENFQRVDSPIITDPSGAEIGALLGTGLFIQHSTMVRVIHYQGAGVDDVARHMSTQEGVHEAERKLAPYLRTARDTETPEGFLAHFARSAMTVLDHRELDDRPASGTVALRFPLRAGAGAELAGLFPRETPTLDLDAAHPNIVRVALFVHGDTAIRAVQYDGHAYDVVQYLLAQEYRSSTEDWLVPYVRQHDAASTADAYLVQLHAHAMRNVSHLSVLGVG